MKFEIDNKIFEPFPKLNIGVVVAKEIDNTGASKDVMDLIKKQSETIKTDFDLETLSENPGIKSWRDAYSLFGAKPKKNRSSIENLYQMILEGVEIRHINKAVDIYNYISMKRMIPIGGDDIDKIDGDITLKFAKGDESFTQLNSKDVSNPKTGEIVYTDDKKILCRRWNWRECDKSKMTDDTKNMILVMEGLPPITEKEVRSITDELGKLIQKFCGGKIELFTLNDKMQKINF